MKLCGIVVSGLAVTLASAAPTPRARLLMDSGWKFNLGDHGPPDPSSTCTDANFTIDLTNKQCLGLTKAAQYADIEGCRDGCCGDDSCEAYQWCPADSDGDCTPKGSCWLGKMDDCGHDGNGWVSRGRQLAPTPAPAPGPGGDACNQPFCKVDYSDDDWRDVAVPHDFVIEGNFSASCADKSHGFLCYGVGWYRLHFATPANADNADVWIDFDGVQRDSDIWLNGKALGHHDSGYSNFRFNVQGKLNTDGKPNVLAVRTDCTKPDGWWYDGGGIYRHVWLTVADELHVAADGVFANVTVNQINDGAETGTATVDAQTMVLNAGSVEQKFTVTSQILDSNGKAVGAPGTATATLAAGTNTTTRSSISAADIQLWSDTHPVLYTLRTTVIDASGAQHDEVDTTFGFRKIAFDADKGFLLNDVPVKIRGFANHQDFAGVGVAVPDSLQKFRISKLKEMGANGWRTAHNPPTPALLDEADRQGMLVWDENHRNEVSGQYVDDLRAMLRRDRNHPSVVLWSLCNEALCQGFDAGHAKILYPIVKEFDNGPNARPVTAAMNGGLGDDFSHLVDVTGINYQIRNYASYHQSNPTTRLIGSETASSLQDRGIYANDADKAYMSDYDANHPGWGATAEDAWQPILADDFMSGTFVWTGFDYKGEPTPYSWPNVNSHFGIVDIAGFPKDTFYYYKANWRADLNNTFVYALPHWNWDASNCAGLCSPHSETGDPVTVNVWAYGNVAQVELAVNGNIVGNRTAMPPQGHVEWNVPYTPGTLECRGYDANGARIDAATHTIKTAGAPAALRIEVEQGANGIIANSDDVALIKVSVVDSDGNFCPTSSDKVVSFALTGPAQLIGVGNGDPSCHEPDKASSRTAWNGLARAIVQATDAAGSVTITASAPGLKSATATINSSAPHKPVPSVTAL